MKKSFKALKLYLKSRDEMKYPLEKKIAFCHTQNAHILTVFYSVLTSFNTMVFHVFLCECVYREHLASI